MAAKDSNATLGKFRGCLIGALLGDCLGAQFENGFRISKDKVQTYFDDIESPNFNAPVKHYTDDTAMTRCIAESLIHHNDFNSKDLAQRFVKEYFTEPGRGYGGNVVDIFYKLRAQNCMDPFGPAREQFKGTGSYGNGGAMRIAPVALFCHHNYDQLVDMSRKTTAITHTHKQGVDGAILQAAAVQQSINLDPTQPINVKEFTSSLIEKMKTIEVDEEGLGLEDAPYQRQLLHAEKLLAIPEGARDDQVQEILGTSVAAIYSVPTAIFCFLRAQNSIPDINTDNPFRRTIQYAVSLGGDTDTIASMAGAMAGAFYGESIINETLLKHCEDGEDIIRLADTLFEVYSSRG